MDRRTLYRTALLLLTGLGVGLAAQPFIAALQPSQRVNATLLRIDLSALPAGQWQREVWQPSGAGPRQAGQDLVLYRKHDGTLRIWLLPTKQGATAMPDIHWWNSALYWCKAFGPSLRAGVVDEQAAIRCHDPETPEWWRRHWQWDVDGKSLTGNVDDLPSMNGVIEGHYFVVGKHS